MKILIAEDDIISSRDLEKHLKEGRYDVVTARDGNEAWHNMPGINGTSYRSRHD